MEVAQTDSESLQTGGPDMEGKVGKAKEARIMNRDERRINW